MTRIKMIVTDIDGTLLTDKGTISHDTRLALINAQEQGIRMVIATGRGIIYTKQQQKQLEMERFPGNYIIALNGQEIYRLSDGSSWQGPKIPAFQMPSILKMAYDWGLEALCYVNDTRYHYLPPDYDQKKEAWLKEHGSQACNDFEAILGDKIPVMYWDSPFPEDVSKVAFLHTPLYLAQVLPLVRTSLKPGLQAVLTKPNWLEIFPAGISKGTALKHIMEDTGISKNQVLVFGDGENDIDMFRAATFSFAMGNALPSVKKAAYAVTGTNNQDGIAAALRSFTESDGSLTPSDKQ